MEKPACKKLFEKVLTFWDKLTPEEQDSLCRATMYQAFKKGENVHGGSGECTGGILVKSGSMRAYMLSEEGREVTLYRLFPGDICMLSASCVLEAVTFDVFIDAEEASECFIINSKAFATLTSTNVYAENFALNIAVTRFSEVMWVMQQILFMSLDKRLAIFLYDEISKSGDLTVELTQDKIAKYMGSAREAVSRMLKYFSAEGIAEAIRGGVKILDKEKLRALALN